MKLEERVCSLELAKKLKKLSVPQDSYWWWHYNKTTRKWYLDKNLGGRFPNPRSSLSAFTVAELGEMLPHSIEKNEQGYMLAFEKYETMWSIFYADCLKIGISGFEEYTEADARAKMLIYLIENKLVRVEDL